jgi:hypothetical protein
MKAKIDFMRVLPIDLFAALAIWRIIRQSVNFYRRVSDNANKISNLPFWRLWQTTPNLWQIKPNTKGSAVLQKMKAIRNRLVNGI